jgi:hypothetical protein
MQQKKIIFCAMNRIVFPVGNLDYLIGILLLRIMNDKNHCSKIRRGSFQTFSAAGEKIWRGFLGKRSKKFVLKK